LSVHRAPGDRNNVVEIGPGIGALTKRLVQVYPQGLTAIEVDARAVAFLNSKKDELPGLTIVHQDVLTVNWANLARERGCRLHVIGNSKR